MKKTKISVITCVKEDDESIKATYASIFPQLDENIEWIIKYSHDCTTEFSEEMPAHPSIKKITQSDTSLYDGLNQALNHCSTEFYLVLGAGDTLFQNAWETLHLELNENPGFHAYFFGIFVESRGHTLTPEPTLMPTKMACPHPGALLRTDLSLAIGGFDRSYQIASDYDHLCRYLNKYQTYKTSKELITKFKGGGISETRWLEGALEEELIRIRQYGSNLFAVFGRLLAIVSPQIISLLSINFK
jgi:hypothetical protein